MEKSIRITLKNGEKILLNCAPVDRLGEKHKIKAINNKDEMVAFASFNLKWGKSCYLNVVEIVDNNYARQGLCSKILRFMEYIAARQSCYKIEGKFYPFGDLGNYAKDFYTKNGYNIIKEYYDTEIFKRVDNDMDIEKTI